MTLKKVLTLLTMTLFIASLTACSSNQIEPATKAESVTSSEKVTTQKGNELPQAKLVQPSRGSGQSTGAKIGVYVLKTAVSAAITYFITKAIIDYIKKDVTGED
jgi:hypothetical protein